MNTDMQSISTPRLILRRWRIGDARDLYEYASDPEVGPMAGWKPHESLQESELIIGGVFLKLNNGWAVTLRDSGKVIGSVDLHGDNLRPNTKTRMLGYTLSKSFWGHGLAPEAGRAAVAYGFNRLGLELISVGHFPENHRSRRVIEKLGFVYEGTMRRCLAIYDGSVRDIVRYSMTREEFQNNLKETEASL